MEYLVEKCDPESGTIPKCHCCYNHEDISESGIITGKLGKKILENQRPSTQWQISLFRQ